MFCFLQTRLMMSILNSGFTLTEEQRARNVQIQDWLANHYVPEMAQLDKDLADARAEYRRLSKNDWKLVSKAWKALHNKD